MVVIVLETLTSGRFDSKKTSGLTVCIVLET